MWIINYIVQVSLASFKDEILNWRFTPGVTVDQGAPLSYIQDYSKHLYYEIMYKSDSAYMMMASSSTLAEIVLWGNTLAPLT